MNVRSILPVPLRPAKAAALAVAAFAVLASAAQAATLERPDAREIAHSAPLRDAILAGPTRSLAARDVWGDTYTTADGEQVKILASDAYPQDDARGLQWATFLTSLVHGSELATVTLLLEPSDEVETTCGSGALACYSPYLRTIVAPGEDPGGDLSAEAIVTHEYGHHVAASRSNAPWEAVEWGTKRWATAMNICSRTASGELSPGNEGSDYRSNPGEAFAESYRVLNERRAGKPESPWQVVSQTLYPGDEALQALDLDVTQPWTGASATSFSGRFVKGSGRSRSFTVGTPLDGTLRLTLRGPRKSSFRLEILAGGTRVASTTTRTLSATICGRRSYVARVTRVKGFGAFTLAVSRP